MKTILEWFQELPEPYRTQAIDNLEVDPDSEVKSLRLALSSSFLWEVSPQGHEYWENLSNMIREGCSHELPPPTGWQPMTTAPKDGTIVLACSRKHYVPQSVCWASYHPNAKGKECWRTSAIGGNKAEGLTHWMPLPEPPSVD